MSHCKDCHLYAEEIRKTLTGDGIKRLEASRALHEQNYRQVVVLLTLDL